MNESDPGGENGGATGSKLARVLDAYDMADIGDELVRRWTSEGEDRLSVREMVDYVNRRVMERALAEADVRPLDGEVANLYRLLTDDDVSGAERTRVRRRLEREGVDVGTLESNLVSRQAVYTYLTSYRDADYQPPENAGASADVDAIGRLRSRLQAMVDGRVNRMRTDGDLAIEDPQVLVDVRVFCEACGTEFGVADLREGRQCTCD